MKSLFFSIAILCFLGISAQIKPCNCCSEKHAEFDFWIGEWTVTNPDGSAAGTNSIVKTQDNCVLQENWISARGNFTGTSNNFYNYKTKQWEQIWIDNKGQSLHLKRSRKGHQMILQTDEETNEEGKLFYHRVTWTIKNDGSVRQYWETITNTTEVTVAFDGLYQKK